MIIFNKIRAFSLIELMVVIAIVAVLATVAVSSYKQYVAKTKFTEILSLMTEPITLQLQTVIETNQSLPAPKGESDCFGELPTAYGNYIDYIEFQDNYDVTICTIDPSGIPILDHTNGSELFFQYKADANDNLSLYSISFTYVNTNLDELSDFMSGTPCSTCYSGGLNYICYCN